MLLSGIAAHWWIHKIGETSRRCATNGLDGQGKSVVSPSHLPLQQLNGKVLIKNIIDTPGHVDFYLVNTDTLDGAVTVLDSNQVLSLKLKTVWRQTTEYGVPRIVFANKMDKIGSWLPLLNKRTLHDGIFKQTLTQFNCNRCWRYMKSLTWSRWKLKSILTTGADISEEYYSNEYLEQAQEYREKLVEAVAETDENDDGNTLKGKKSQTKNWSWYP